MFFSGVAGYLHINIVHTILLQNFSTGPYLAPLGSLCHEELCAYQLKQISYAPVLNMLLDHICMLQKIPDGTCIYMVEALLSCKSRYITSLQIHKKLKI